MGKHYFEKSGNGMNAILHEFKKQTRQFGRRWWLYLTLFISVDLVIQLLVIPIFRFVTTFILQAGEIPFVSYQNVLTIIQDHPLVVAALIIELFVLLLVVYWQFAMILLGVRAIYQGTASVRGLLIENGRVLRQLRLASLFVLLGYFVLVIPFADFVFRTPLLSKIQIPAFILDFMTRNGILLTILIAFYVVMIILGVRFLLALPLMVYREQRPQLALLNSWRLTKHGRWWPLVARILTAGVIASVITGLFYTFMVGLQFLFDLLPGKLALTAAVLNLSIIQVGSEALMVWTGVVTIMFLMTPLKMMVRSQPLRITRGIKRILVVAVSLMVVVVLINNTFYLNSNHQRPLIIAHRGVADENGVQNTIPAMERTHRLHPDYVEMDVHETRDHQFVVMHDENLKKLTGVNKAPDQLTLKQLTHLTARENGHQAKIASLDDYLRAAAHYHQHLLIEIKTTPHDSRGMLRNFNRRYGKTILAHHDKIHSLDYHVVTTLKRLNPRLDVFYIQPYDFTYPNTGADGYSMEYSTLTHDFINLAHLQHKQVYAWTVDNQNVMQQEMYNHVDGIVTDNLRELNIAVKAYEDHQSPAQQIINYIMVIPTSQEFTP